MPLNKEIKKVLVIGSGPIIIGQAAEFDYSGTQSCLALKEEGIEVVLINSNPATIMTDQEIADKIYIEPLTVETVEKVIIEESPDSVLAGVGGQTALNLALELDSLGILEKYNVKVIGTEIDGIQKGEDRQLFRELMDEIGQPVIDSVVVKTLEDGLAYAAKIGYPLVVRPAFTLGGSGGGIAESPKELEEILRTGIHLSKTSEVLLEKSIKGYKEVEYEVMRDGAGNCISVCNMENVDPVGVHTGDSIVVAPSQTLADKEYHMLRTASLEIIEAVGIKGGCNVQIALCPNSFDYVIIEINPRVSRSSALASKATGYPIARVATKIALGYNLDEILNEVTGKTYACFEPTLDYVVTKIPKWPFDKFHKANRKLGTKMMATGEVMAIGNTFEQSFLKAIRSLEINQYTLYFPKKTKLTLDELKVRAVMPDDERIFDIAEMIRRNYRLEMLCKITGMDYFFLSKIKKIVDLETQLREMTISGLDEHFLRELKQLGFSDKGMADLIGCSPQDILALRNIYKVLPTYKMVDTCAGEFEAVSPYYYSTYGKFDEVKTESTKKKVMVIGSGPIRIGQGVEFDYCSVHSILALKEQGYETIIINNNPETVSTDYSIADKLYFEPLTKEDVLNVVEKEKPYGAILQFGGQTAIKLAGFFREMGIKVLGTSPEQMDAAEDREKFDDLLEGLEIKRPEGKTVMSIEEGLEAVEELGYPVLVRPSYVLGGQGMEIVHEESVFIEYLGYILEKDKKNPVLVDKFIEGTEIEVDAICDGENILIPGIMEHLERAGIHSGDSISIYPPINCSDDVKNQLLDYTKRIAQDLKIVGMVNIQFILFEGTIYIIEVNPRSSRTVPYISKVTGVPIIALATRAMLGEKLVDMGYGIDLYKESEYYAVKVPVFSTQKLTGVEISLGPEMKSTGEVLGIDKDVYKALYKGFLGAGMNLELSRKKILATLNKYSVDEFLDVFKSFSDDGYTFLATEGTHKKFIENGITSTEVKKIGEGEPNIMEVIRNREVDAIVNTPTKGAAASYDSFLIRRTSVEYSIDTYTALDTFRALHDIVKKDIKVKDLDVISIDKIV